MLPAVDPARWFDQPPERRGTDSYKWQRYAGQDILPMWVADMDFAAPPPVLDALQARVAHGVMGYAHPPASLNLTTTAYCQRQYGWTIEPGWMVWLPGLVVGLNVACRAVGQAGDGVLTATPIYPPFCTAPALSQRSLIRVPLQETPAGWGWDLNALEAAITPNTRLLLLCHPHNPVGQVWDIATLQGLADIAKRHNLVVVSDEVHCDLILDPTLQHVPFAQACPDLAERTITLMAPSKTYNLAGLGCAFAVIPHAGLRRQFMQAMAGIVPHVNVLGLLACEVALSGDCEPWRLALLDYLRNNRNTLYQQLDGYAGLRLHGGPATYLAWLDARKTGLDAPHARLEAAGVGLSDGGDFGAPGWLRLNFGASQALVTEACQRIRRALVS